MRITSRLRAALAAAAAVVLLASCAADPTESPSGSESVAADQQAANDILAPYGLANLDAKAVIEKLDTMPVAERPTDLMASIRTEALQLTDATGKEAALPLPDDEFYVSLAPYVNQTHDCFYHSLTTCRGELANAEVVVNVTAEDGTVLVDETITTYDNGFFGLWLPRDVTGTITVEYDGKTVTAPLATGPEDATCVTTLQLA